MTNIIGLVTATFAGGVWCGGYFSLPLPLLYVSSIALVILIIWQNYVHKPLSWSVGLLFFLVGVIRFIHADALAPTDISRYAGQTMVVYGTISEIPKVTLLEEGNSKVLYLVSVKEGQLAERKKIQVTGILSVAVRQASNRPMPSQGDEVRLKGEIALLHGYNNPAQYDSVATAQRQGIRGRMSIQDQDISLIGKQNKVSWQTTMALWREKIIKNMERVMPQYHASILAGMLFGGYEGIPRDIVSDFATTGIVHILSVSGSHIALVVGVITVVGTAVGRRFAVSTKVVPLFAASLVTFYAVFCGLTPPVLRSLIMGLIALFAVCFEREKDAANALLLSALGMLVHEPSLIYDLSFQLSFASSAGLVFLNTKTVAMMTGVPTGLAKLLSVTIAAQLGVLPFIAWYFNSFSLSSFVANVLIVPLIECLVILGLFGAGIGLLVGVAGNIIMVLCSLLIGIIIQCTAWLAMIPGAKLYLPSAGLVGSLLYYLLLAWVYGYKPRNMLSLGELIQKWPKVSATTLLGILICAILYSVYPRPVSVHFIDVGQGDCTLIITPHGRAILVDTGGVMGSATDFDIGERVVVPYLKHYGVLAIDYLFLTHGHQDHAGGAAGIARALPVRNSMLAREPFTQAVRKLVQVAPTSLFIPVYDAQEIAIDGVALHVVHAVSGQEAGHSNEVSSVVQVSYGKFSFLLTGDLEGKGEDEILTSGENISSTVLKVCHHGSKTSSTIDFLQAVAPEYAVISVGKDNHFGHPHEDTLTRLLSQHSKIYRTDQQGAIVFKTDGRTLAVDTFLK